MPGSRCGINVTARPPTCPGSGAAEARSSTSCSLTPLKDTFGDGELVPLGPHLRQLLGELFFEFVQFRTPRGDPFQQLGIVEFRRPQRAGIGCR
ncbi:hypothetical protein ABZV67_25010 [Streptomyces sp. NPDC005065]|uniref:hypothetical protein n=1 Tax=Streptomyces sp. NPDC005065 TaxID=3154461 RepID=UPI0033A69361